MASNPSPQGPDTTARTPDPLAVIRREAIILGIALASGFIVVPLLTWVVGNRILGPYVHTQDPTAGTGPMRLMADFFGGLAHGSVIFWCVVSGPYVLLTLIRFLYAFVRSPDLRRSSARGV
jgi:hypothetical protein